MSPKRPSNLDPLAQRILSELAGQPEAEEVVLGGYLALQHYVDYRESHDIDAWWRERASPGTEAMIRAVMERVATETGLTLKVRQFGETISFELHSAGQRTFSFQIATRSVLLEPPCESSWAPVLLESFADTIGGKMNALVDRGAPRDFLDIFEVNQKGACTPGQCWGWWERKNPQRPIEEARQRVLIHLSALEQRRPLGNIANPPEKLRAQRLREWFRGTFLSA